MRVALGADHAGVALKDELATHLAAAGHTVEDLGTDSADSVDYPDFAAAVAHRVVGGAVDLGVLCCGTGIGMAIAANKVVGVRAAVAHDVTTAVLARAHNDANVLCMGARIVGSAVALDALDAFVATSFDGGRHGRRVEKIHRLEEET